MDKQKTLEQRYKSLELQKTSIESRCEQYARWTLPSIFPPTSSVQDTGNAIGPNDSIGAQAVNHLANKLSSTLFQPHAPFFKLIVQSDKMKAIALMAEQGDDTAKGVLESLDKTLADTERDAWRDMNYGQFRTTTTLACKHLLITGNAVHYDPKSSQSRVYSLRDYVVVRDLAGVVIELITRDSKAFATLATEIQDQLRAARDKEYNDDTDVTIYTQIRLKDGKYHMKQAADCVELDSEGVYAPEDCPWIVLTWNLMPGNNYGSGLVEEFAGAFNSVDVLTEAMIDLVGTLADIKWLVDPASVIDVKQMNESPRGSFHSGKATDVGVIQTGKVQDLNAVLQVIESFKKQIAQAFLLSSAIRRDAERVTAEEIRQDAMELEMSHGGIYSRFADEWQLRVATIHLRRIGAHLTELNIKPQIITGLDSLSRAGELDNLRMFVSDMTMLREMPEQLLQVVDPLRFAEYTAIRRGVEYTKFLKSTQQMQQEAQAQQEAMQQQLNAQTGAVVAQEAGKAVFNQRG